MPIGDVFLEIVGPKIRRWECINLGVADTIDYMSRKPYVCNKMIENVFLERMYVVWAWGLILILGRLFRVWEIDRVSLSTFSISAFSSTDNWIVSFRGGWICFFGSDCCCMRSDCHVFKCFVWDRESLLGSSVRLDHKPSAESNRRSKISSQSWRSIFALVVVICIPPPRRG